MTSDLDIQYWDSPLFLNLLTNREPRRAAVVYELLEMASAKKIKIVLSNLVIAEMRPPGGSPDHYVQRIDELFDRDYLTFQSVNRTVSLIARDLARQFPALSVLDTLHLGTALQMGAQRFFTYAGESQGLFAYDGKIRQNTSKPALAIQEPFVISGPMDEALKKLSSGPVG